MDTSSTATTTTTTRLRRIRRAAAALVAGALIGTVGMAAPAFANSQTLWGATGDTQGAASDTSSHVVTVRPSATPMSAYSSQAVSYYVAYRDLTADGPWQFSGWQPYSWVSQSSFQGACDFNGCATITMGGGTPLSPYSFYGTPGHQYTIYVMFEWFIPYRGWVASGVWSQVTSCYVTTTSSGIDLPFSGGLCTT